MTIDHIEGLTQTLECREACRRWPSVADIRRVQQMHRNLYLEVAWVDMPWWDDLRIRLTRLERRALAAP